MVWIAQDFFRNTPTDTVLTVNSDSDDADHFSCDLLDPHSFSGILCGFFYIKPSVALYGNGTCNVFLFGDELFVRLVRAGSGNGLDFEIGFNSTAASTFSITSLVSAVAGAPWYQVYFYIDWNTPANSELKLNDVVQSFDVVATAVPPNQDFSSLDILTNVEGGTEWAQLWIMCQENFYNTNMVKDVWDKGKKRLSSYSPVTGDYSNGKPFLVGKQGAVLFSRTPAFYTAFKNAGDAFILNEATGVACQNNGIDMTITDKNVINLGV